MMKFLTVIIAFVSLAAIGYKLCPAMVKSGDKRFSAGLQPIPVATVTVEPTSLSRSLSAIGVLEAVRQVKISSEVTGLVRELSFQAGQQVKTDHVLLQIDDAEEQANLRLFRAELSSLKKELERVKKLGGLASSQSRIDEAQMLFERSQANIDHTLAMIEKKRIKAPFAGTMGIAKTKKGELLKSGTVIVSMTDTTRFLLNFSLAERVIEKIDIGQSVEFRVDAIPDQVFFATIAAVEPIIDQNTHMISVQAELAETTRRLRPGMFGHVSVLLDPLSNVLLLPETAVQVTTYGNSVYLVKQDQTGEYSVVRVGVKIGRRQNGQVVIQGGLGQGDVVVVSGQNRLRDGASVVVKSDSKTTPMVITQT
ncbi:efflux RND transporter periplasmic adaptor subunit [Microbulbifer sp. ZKSA006]|uniref:efflux RND transporter periplasmic adaptor subunit n=1 Tax=Microbulbifer sp. ZKSA006 TaxID=3243390 RepID=UPI004039A622